MLSVGVVGLLTRLTVARLGAGAVAGLVVVGLPHAGMGVVARPGGVQAGDLLGSAAAQPGASGRAGPRPPPADEDEGRDPAASGRECEGDNENYGRGRVEAESSRFA